MNIHRDPQAMEIAALRERVAELEAQVRQLTRPLERYWFEDEVPLTPSQRRILSALTRATPGSIVSRDTMMTVLYGERLNDWPDTQTIDQLMLHLRRKLHRIRPVPVIQTVVRQGWRLSPTSHGIIKGKQRREAPGPT